MLFLLQGPAGGGKSQVAAEMLASGQADLFADVTALWAALRGFERDPVTGKYPVRRDDDPALELARYLQATAVRQGLREGIGVVVTTSRHGQIERWRVLAVEADTTLDVTTVDPGYDVVRGRLADPVTGTLSPECSAAIGRWYG